MARFGFAWVNEDEDFGPEHQREDELVVSFSVEQSEGDFASLTIVIKNPRIGLLAPARMIWAWLSLGATPLFFGRLIGIPTSINQEAVTLVFQARPSDYQAQKEALAATMRDLPYYDPVWLTLEAQADPDTVLEARPQLWHVDRVTHELTASGILAGEDGALTFLDEAEVPWDSVQISIGQVSSRILQITGDVSWSQGSSGAFDMGVFQIDTFSGKSLLENWPKPGTDIGGGWSCAAASITDNLKIDDTESKPYSVNWSNEAGTHNPGDTTSISISSTIADLRGDFVEIVLTTGSQSGANVASTTTTSMKVPEWKLTGTLQLGYNALRERKESITFVMKTNLQALVTLPDDSDIEQLSISGGDVGIPLGGEPPIGDVRNRSYFMSDRGLRSLEWLINRGRAQLMLNSRAIEISFDVPFLRAVDCTLRKDAVLYDPRLPGGQVVGKVIRYSFSADGDQGQLIGNITIGCAIGYGGSVASAPGDPDYCDTDYVEDDYQQFLNQLVALDASDVAYIVPAGNPADDGLHFPLGRHNIIQCEVLGDVDAQRAGLQALADGFVLPSLSGIRGTQAEIDAIVNRASVIPKQVDDFLKVNSHYLRLRVPNLESGPFVTDYFTEVTALEVPQGINLEWGTPL